MKAGEYRMREQQKLREAIRREQIRELRELVDAARRYLEDDITQDELYEIYRQKGQV